LRPAYSLRETAVFTRRRRVKVEFLSYILFSVAVASSKWQWHCQYCLSLAVDLTVAGSGPLLVAVAGSGSGTGTVAVSGSASGTGSASEGQVGVRQCHWQCGMAVWQWHWQCGSGTGSVAVQAVHSSGFSHGGTVSGSAVPLLPLAVAVLPPAAGRPAWCPSV
jgi:hypothetical protein